MAPAARQVAQAKKQAGLTNRVAVDVAVDGVEVGAAQSSGGECQRASIGVVGHRTGCLVEREQGMLQAHARQLRDRLGPKVRGRLACWMKGS